MSLNVRLELTDESLKVLEEVLGKTLPKAFDDSVTAALNEAAEMAKNRAKQSVPVDTGALRDSIRVERFARPAGNITYTGVRAGGYIRNPKTGRFVDYASYVEYGTSRQRPQPFLRPALNHVIKKIPDLFYRELAKRVDLK